VTRKFPAACNESAEFRRRGRGDERPERFPRTLVLRGDRSASNAPPLYRLRQPPEKQCVAARNPSAVSDRLNSGSFASAPIPSDGAQHEQAGQEQEYGRAVGHDAAQCEEEPVTLTRNQRSSSRGIRDHLQPETPVIFVGIRNGPIVPPPLRLGAVARPHP